MSRVLAALLSVSLFLSPVMASPAASSSPLGTIVYSDRGHVGAAPVSVGATVFNGDRLSTEATGAVQLRTASARLVLKSSSVATLSQDEGSPSATLALGSATFSTASAKAFVLHVGNAQIRPNTDQPTIAEVTVLNAKELVVKSVRGSLSFGVEDDVRVVPEGAAYRVVLDPSDTSSDPQGPRGVGGRGPGGPPVKAGRSKFVWYAIAITAVITGLALSEVFESPSRP